MKTHFVQRSVAVAMFAALALFSTGARAQNSVWVVSSMPTQMQGFPEPIAVCVGTNVGFNLILAKDGTVWAWGDNSYGELGHSPGTDGDANRSNLSPHQITGLTGVTSIAAGGTFGLALESDGTVWAWGLNNVGQLGHVPGVGGDAGSGNYYNSTASKVAGLVGVTAIAAGNDHCLALDSNGRVWAWGGNSYGDLGHAPGSVGDGMGQYGEYLNAVPTQVNGLSGVKAISAGYECSLALVGNGTVCSWGYNYSGQLGIGSADGNAHATPMIVTGLSSILAVACGNGFGLALKMDGTVWEWGSVDGGGPSATPTEEGGLSGVISISASEFAYAVKENGTLWSWGNTYTPLYQVAGLSGVTAISASGASGESLVVVHKNDFYWQNASSGQLAYWNVQFGTGSPSVASGNYLSSSLAPPWRLAAVADFNGDGALDLLWQNMSTGDVVVWYMGYSNGVASILDGGYVVHGASATWRVVGATDFDGDGYPDLLWQNATTGDVTWWRMALINGVPTQTGGGYVAKRVGEQWSAVGIADFNRDDYPDLLWRNTTTGDVIWWQMAFQSGAPTPVGGGYIARGVSSSWKLVGATDMNGDGEPDLLWQNATTGQLDWWELAYQNGAVTTVGGGYIPPLSSAAWQLAGGL